MCVCSLFVTGAWGFFSICSQVYGETSFKLVTQIIDKVGIRKDDKFIDLGSGMFHSILYV